MRKLIHKLLFPPPESSRVRRYSPQPPNGCARCGQSRLPRLIAAAAQGLGSEMNGWQLPPVATEYFGTDYLYRAAVGWQSMYVNDPIEAKMQAFYASAGFRIKLISDE